MPNPNWCPYIKKKIGKLIHIFDPSLFQNYYVIITNSQKEFIAIVKKQLNLTIPYDKECDGHFYHIHRKIKSKDTPIALIWSENKIATIVHECFHAVWWALNRKGILVTKDNDEMMAYHLEFLVKSILEK
jgi:hypothetical protein